MAIQQQFLFGWAGQGGVNPITVPVILSADGEDNRSIDLTPGQVVVVDLAWTEESLKGLFAYSPSDFRMTINPAGSSHDNPSESFDVTDAIPLQWVAASGLPYPFEPTTVVEVRLESLEETDDQTVTIKTIQDSTL
jgi:hypothetical protein